MSTFWYLLIIGILGQNPKSEPPAEPQKKAETAVSKDSTKPPEPPADDPETPHDKFVKEQAAKLDKIVDVAAELYYAVRNQDRLMETTGTYKLGPQDRMRFDLTFSAGGVTGKRMYVSDGVDSYHIEEFGDNKRGRHFKVDKLKPLLQDKNVPEEERNQIFNGIVPFQKPGAMLRGYLTRMTFTDRSEEKLGDRDAVVLEGRWKKSTVNLLTGGDQKKGFDDIDPAIPRYIKLKLDKETGWPLQVELYQKLEKIGVFKPVLSLKFSKLVVGKRVAEAEFKFVPPTNMQIQDVTPIFEAALKRRIESAAAAAAAKKSETETKKEEKPAETKGTG